MTIQAFMKLRGTVIDITHGSSISQSWLTNHFMTHPPDFEISLSPLKLLLSNNNKKKKKKRERNCFWEHPSAQSPSFLNPLPQSGCWIQEGSDIAMKHEAN